jgi:CubicO group peptidase (beta-lactamase class C family)
MKKNLLQLSMLAFGMVMPVSSAFASYRQNLDQFLFHRKDGINTDAYIVIKEGRVLYQSYARGYKADTKHFSWSMAKTFGGILIGQAIDEGRLHLDDQVKNWLPGMQTNATIKDVLNMSSGIHYREEYAGVPVNSDATKMLYLDAAKTGFAAYTASLPARNNSSPGHHFYYSSGDANLLMGVLQKVINNQQEYNDYPWKKLFGPLEIKSATFEQDSAGTFVGSSYIYMTPQDYVKVGELLMNKGKFKQKQIIPPWYFNLMNTVAEGVKEKALSGTDPSRIYSSQITTNRPVPERNLLSQYPDLPEDAMIMIGHQGQLVIASPSQKLIIVRLASDKKDNLDRQVLFSLTKKLIEDNLYSISVARDASPHQYEHQKLPLHEKEAGKTPLSEYFKVPHLIRALAAKEFCSCVNVSHRSKELCEDDLKTQLPIIPVLRINSHDQSVTATLGAGFKSSHARFISEKLGCTLVESK